MLNPELDATGRRRVLMTAGIILACIALFLSLFFWKINQPRALNRAELNANGLFLFDAPRRFEDFSFIDEQGEDFGREQLLGKWTMIFPGYTFCPDICPVTMAELGRMWELLDAGPQRDLQVALLSVDPHRDTPQRLREYVGYFNPAFRGLTADLETLTHVGAQWNIAFTLVDPNQVGEDFYTVDHSGNIVLINPAGHYVGFFKPPFDPARLKLTYQSVWITE